MQRSLQGSGTAKEKKDKRTGDLVKGNCLVLVIKLHQAQAQNK